LSEKYNNVNIQRLMIDLEIKKYDQALDEKLYDAYFEVMLKSQKGGGSI
jgi:hypothetical protein